MKRQLAGTRVRSEKRRGVTLIMVAGVLAILAALGAGFYSIMFMQTKSATRFSDAVRAELMAKAGIEDGIARLRDQTFRKTEDPSDPWYTVNYHKGGARKISFAQQDIVAGGEDFKAYTRALGNSAGTNSDRYILNVTDAASKINVNAGDNLAVILDNLCRVIGAPLVPADLEYLQPRRWSEEGADAGMYGKNGDDTAMRRDLYYFEPGMEQKTKLHPDGSGRALYGDGYAIAAYRSIHGRFKTLADIKAALTVVPNPDHPELELLEREVKFAALRDYVTLNSWVDTNTVCVGKFEWVTSNSGNALAIDRDKSWIAHELKGCTVAILNGHGTGQVRRILDNGIDWIEVEQGYVLEPGPISSYMIVAKDDALTETVTTPSGPIQMPKVNPDGTLVDDPAIDYQRHPLCIHRAPVNINTASDKVLAALFLGLNVQHGHPMSVGTDADLENYRGQWKKDDLVLKLEPYLLTSKGLKRIPLSSGRVVLDLPLPTQDVNYGYLSNYGSLSKPNFVEKGGVINEAHELAYRIIQARQRTVDDTGRSKTGKDPDPTTADTSKGFEGYERGPFKSWDDLYWRVIRPWDDVRSYAKGSAVPYAGKPAQTGRGKASVARMLMAHFNSNTDLVKYNPNIEWIDRWGRNFTEMEPVMIFDGDNPKISKNMKVDPKPLGAQSGSYLIRSMRYKSDEMVDKSDLNRSTTEFSFDSGGIFEIQSVGQIAKGNELLAERRIDALVKIYDVWRESTQRHFTQGTFTQAFSQHKNKVIGNAGNVESASAHDAGKVARDAVHKGEKLALDTLPEPLVPLDYRIINKNSFEWVDDTQKDAFKMPRACDIPDVLVNRVLPASFDGQLVLASNTRDFCTTGEGDFPARALGPDYMDTFLASFNGDLDTDTSLGNGREMAKTPNDPAIRVVDTISVLGLLGDTEIDIDPESKDVFVIPSSEMSPLATIAADPVTGAAGRSAYWNNMAVRAGDLRNEGVYVGTMGTSLKDGTLKYAFDTCIAPEYNKGQPKNEVKGKNYYPGSPDGVTISMWFKPTWHGTDNREHIFFDGSMLGNDDNAQYNTLYKGGQFSFAKRNPGSSGQFARNNCLWFGTEDASDNDIMTYLHGGTQDVDSKNLPPNDLTESPSYYVQPFRWAFIGAAFKYKESFKVPQPAGSVQTGGMWHSHSKTNDNYRTDVVTHIARPFISTQRHPEGPEWKPDNYWIYHQGGISGNRLGDCALKGQPACYIYKNLAQHNNAANRQQGVFSISNVNESGDPVSWIYRSTPMDGTYAVIDELKLAKKMWTTDHIAAEMTVSRYYMPRDPSDKKQCPYFDSQTLLQSQKGFDKKSGANNEDVVLARVSWTVFTPRFMHEHKELGEDRGHNKKHDRKEVIDGAVSPTTKFRGPFNYAMYNYDWGYDVKPDGGGLGWKAVDFDPNYGVDRVPSEPGTQPHYTTGVEIEVLDDYNPVNGYEVRRNVESGKLEVNPTTTFENPDHVNTFCHPTDSSRTVRVKPDNLRYRVRFLYPVDPNVDVSDTSMRRSIFDKIPGQPPSTRPTVNPAKHYLVDTPVFDDISITYITTPRILSYVDVVE